MAQAVSVVNADRFPLHQSGKNDTANLSSYGLLLLLLAVGLNFIQSFGLPLLTDICTQVRREPIPEFDLTSNQMYYSCAGEIYKEKQFSQLKELIDFDANLLIFLAF